MRIVTRLRITSALTVAALCVLVPVLVDSIMDFRRARGDHELAETIKLNFFERAGFRDQYFLYREDRARAQWEKSKETADELMRRAAAQFLSEEERQILERLHEDTEKSADIFHRIVINTQMLKSAAGNRQVYEELDKRLASQLLLKAAAIRNNATALRDACEKRVEQTYQYMTIVVILFALTLALATILTSMQLGSLIRRRLIPLHHGAQVVAGGNLDYRIRAGGNDEFADLAQSINTMTDRLQAFTRQLEAEALAHKQVAIALRESEDRLQMALSGADMATWDWHLPSGTLLFNDRWAEIIGYGPGELASRVESWETSVFPGDMANVKAQLNLHFKAKTAMYEAEYRVRHKDGHWVWVHGRGKVVERDDAGNPVRAVGIALDITGRKQSEEKLYQAASVFTHAREGIMITTADGKIIDVNEAFTRITSYSRDEVLGRNPSILKSGHQGKDFYAALWHDLNENGHWYGDIWNRRKNGEVYAAMLTISSVRDAQGQVRQYVALFSDITPLKEHEQQLEYIAHYDALTGLPNRVLFADRLHQAMVQAQRRRQPLAVVYLDLDGFKAVNDREGHDIGDRLLMAVAARMKEVLREGDTLARLGGDEFVAILLDLVDAAASEPLLTRLLAAAAQPLSVGQLVLRVSASAGVAFYPQPTELDADQLLRQADQAMYQAKLAGKNRYHHYVADEAEASSSA